jgi:hypothetical protein
MEEKNTGVLGVKAEITCLACQNLLKSNHFTQCSFSISPAPLLLTLLFLPGVLAFYVPKANWDNAPKFFYIGSWWTHEYQTAIEDIR